MYLHERSGRVALPRAKVIPPTALVERAPLAAWLAARRVEVGRRIGMVNTLEMTRTDQLVLDLVLEHTVGSTRGKLQIWDR